MAIHPVTAQVIERIQSRSQATRSAYLTLMQRLADEPPARRGFSCSNLAHGVAILSDQEKQHFVDDHQRTIETQQPASQTPWCNVGIVTAYNDMLSAHHPFAQYPDIIKSSLKKQAVSAQVAGGVPAMCDGVTQGQAGMELSLLSRDIIAHSTVIALSHQLFDAAILLGTCDKIVPGLLIGALQFGHLPAIFLPAGPMPSGLSNPEKSKIRQAYAEGKVDQAELLKAEMQCYHSAGTCTFYGTANSNQMLMEFMGLHLPGSSFANPGTSLRSALTEHVLERLANQLHADTMHPLYQVITAESLVNAIVGLLATGGSTNHTIHLIAIAKACGLIVTWEDFAKLAQVVPLLARVYPNGSADINHFDALGGTSFCIQQLLKAGLLCGEATTAFGQSFAEYGQRPELNPKTQTLVWQPVVRDSADESVLRGVNRPFLSSSGLQLVEGNLGQAIVKTSAIDESLWSIKAPAKVFTSQAQLKQAFVQGELQQDFVAVLRFQGPRANGMPELHQLMPVLSSLQSQGHRVALLTDGRLSGASGQVLAALHCTPEAATGGPLSRIHNGDLIEIDAEQGRLVCWVDDHQWQQRLPVLPEPELGLQGCGRDLLAVLRTQLSDAATGATTF